MKYLPFLFTLLLVACGDLPVYGPLDIQNGDGRDPASNSISITTWNVGYGALGAGADFVADGGESMRALNAREITEASNEIGRVAGRFNSRVLFFQELSDANFLTRNVPLIDIIEDNLTDYSSVYWEGLGFSTAPKSLQMSHGMGVYAQNRVDVSHAYELPQEPGFFFMGIKRYYAAIVSEVPIRGSSRKWILLNIHLSAFDEDAGVRRAQIGAVFDFAKAEYAKGNYVVIGGDWNMKISPTEFPHTTADEYLFWVYDFPKDLMPKGWKFATDNNTPTVRTLQKPYVAGENYTMIIDGFAYSPNVRLQDITTLDMQFGQSDHHPVTAVFRAR